MIRRIAANLRPITCPHKTLPHRHIIVNASSATQPAVLSTGYTHQPSRRINRMLSRKEWPMNSRSHLAKNWILTACCCAALVATVSVLLVPARTVAMTSESAKTIVAVAVRRQGFPCNQPTAAERVAENAKPHQSTWKLRCSGASYKVRFNLDMKPDITTINRAN